MLEREYWYVKQKGEKWIIYRQMTDQYGRPSCRSVLPVFYDTKEQAERAAKEMSR